jgi:hypothetical protein
MRQDAALAEHFIDKIAGKLHDLAAELRKIEASFAATGSGQETPATGQSGRHASSA